jgi:hypothetical protein
MRVAQSRTEVRAYPFGKPVPLDVPDDELVDGEQAWRRRYAAQDEGWINGPNARSPYCLRPAKGGRPNRSFTSMSSTSLFVIEGICMPAIRTTPKMK